MSRIAYSSFFVPLKNGAQSRKYHRNARHVVIRRAAAVSNELLIEETLFFWRLSPLTHRYSPPPPPSTWVWPMRLFCGFRGIIQRQPPSINNAMIRTVSTLSMVKKSERSNVTFVAQLNEATFQNEKKKVLVSTVRGDHLSVYDVEYWSSTRLGQIGMFTDSWFRFIVCPNPSELHECEN